MKKANRKNPLIIQVKSDNEIIGTMTCKEFQNYMDRPNTFVSALIKQFNEMKVKLNEPERVQQIINFN